MQVRIAGIAPHIDGTYEVPSPLTTRELHEIKQASGVAPFEIAQAYGNGDAAFKAVIAVIALRRAGKVAPLDLFLDSDYDKTLFEIPELEELLKGPVDPTSASPSGSGGKRSPRSSASREDPPRASGEQT